MKRDLIILKMKNKIKKDNKIIIFSWERKIGSQKIQQTDL
jgi:hypothetical protein